MILGGYATISQQLYSKYLPESVYLDPEGNNFIGAVIEEIKKTSILTAQTKEKLEQIIKKQNNNIDCIVLACTELPLAYKNCDIQGIKTFNPNLEYAKFILKFAKNL